MALASCSRSRSLPPPSSGGSFPGALGCEPGATTTATTTSSSVAPPKRLARGLGQALSLPFRVLRRIAGRARRQGSGGEEEGDFEEEDAALSGAAAASEGAGGDFDEDMIFWEPLSEGEIAAARIPPHLRARLQTLGQLQEEYEQLQASYFEEAEEIERRYQPLLQGQLDKRDLLLRQGVKKPNGPRVVEPVPRFWKAVLTAHPTISQLMNKKDLKVMEYLTDIRSGLLPKGRKGFKLEFEFSPNPYLADKILEKEYVMEDRISMGQNILSEIRCSPPKVTWYAMKDPSLLTVQRKYKNGTVEREVRVGQSFFNLFSPLSLEPLAPEAQLTQFEMDTRLEIERELQFDLDVGFIFKDDIIPQASKYFLSTVPAESDSNPKQGTETIPPP